MRIRNFTRNPLVILGWRMRKGTPTQDVVVIPPDPDGAAFVRFTDHVRHTVPLEGVNFPITCRVFDDTPPDLPPCQNGVFLVVAAPVAAHPALKGRPDILVPHRIRKNEAGDVVGCDGLRLGPGAYA